MKASTKLKGIFIAISLFFSLNYAIAGTFTDNITTVTIASSSWDFHDFNLSFSNFLNKSNRTVTGESLVIHYTGADPDNLVDLDFILNNTKMFRLSDNGSRAFVDNITGSVPGWLPGMPSDPVNFYYGVKDVLSGYNTNWINRTAYNKNNETSEITYKLECKIPTDLLYEESYTFGPGYLNFEDEGNDTYVNDASGWATTVAQTMPGWGNINLGQNLSATAGCGKVTLSWNIQNTDAVDVTSMRARIYKDDNLIKTVACVSGNNNEDILIADYNNHTYEVRVSYALDPYGNVTLNKREESTSQVSISAIPPLPAPFGFEATDDRCDGKIRLSWSWNQAAPASYEIDVLSGSTLVTTLTGISGSSNSYIYTAPAKNVNYTFKIYAMGTQCVGRGYPSSDDGIALDKPLAPSNLTVTQLPGTAHMELKWTDNSHAPSNEDNFRFIRSSSTGNADYIIPADDASYIDEFGAVCVPYTYILRAENVCGVSSSASISAVVAPQALDSTFRTHQFLASKGYFSNKVEMSWNLNNENQLTNVLLLRKRITEQDSAFVQLDLLDPAIKFYIDQTSDANVIYEYALVGRSQCNTNTFYSDTIRSVGFRSAFGTVAGQVNYTGGIAVKDVKITAESTGGYTGNSLLFDGTSSLQVANSSSLQVPDSFTIELWFNPTSHTSNFTLVYKLESYEIGLVGSNYEFSVYNSPTNKYTVSVPASMVNLNNYNQLTATLHNDTMRLYVNGVSTNYTVFSGSVNNNTIPITIGSAFQGNLDEFRYWNVGKDSITVSQDFSRQLSGAESGLKLYLKMNEGGGNYAYDFSHTGTSYNRNHAAFNGSGVQWSSTIPTASQLTTSSYTNASGNYVMIVPYNGVGETFVFTPSYSIHQFNPSTRVLFIGEGNSIHNNIDFEDISSFRVTGDLFYANTTCAVEGATLLVDGNAVISGGQQEVTDANGQFDIRVPIGEHFITVVKNGHVMNVGRFPASGTYNFQDDLAGIHFQDSTLIKVVGRVVGGLREAQYMPGLGKSTNNIGQAQIILTSQQGGGCYTDTLMTDINSGEYITYLPPLRYIPTVTIPSNPTIDFGVLNLLDLNTVPQFTVAYDTLGYDSVNTIYSVDSFSYQKRLDYIYREDPKIVVMDFERPDLPLMGLKEYNYVHPVTNDTISTDLTNPSTAFEWPVFDARGENIDVKAYILVYEEYQNLQNAAIDSVPTTDGKLEFNNELSSLGAHSVQMSDVNTLDSLKYLIYTFPLGKPNFTENASIPEYSFTRKLEINLITSNGTAIPWKPYNFNGTPTGIFNSVYDGIYRAYILGTKSDGQQFITSGPQIPEYVLRDPPGSNSFASREVGSTKTTENSWQWSLGGTTASTDKVFVGAKFLTGIGVEIETDMKNNFNFGFNTLATGGNSGTETTVTTNTQTWETNSVEYLPGRASDLYIGKSKNVTFGISETLNLVPDSLCSTVECVGSPFANFSFAKTYGLSVVPGGYSTQFMYSENDIKDIIIPDLIELRNVMLQSNSKYTSHLSLSDPNYGLNNDDPRVDASLPQLTSDQVIGYMMRLTDSLAYDTINGLNSILSVEKLAVPSGELNEVWQRLKDLENPSYQVMDGLSYTYNATNQQDSLTGDSVRWINNQIRQWELSIMLNEWEKVNINDAGIREKLKDRELTKLYDKYKVNIEAYKALVAISGIAQGIGGVVSVIPIPGTGLIGQYSFAIGSSTGIAAAEVYDDYASYQLQKQQIQDKFNQTSNNYSISGGNSFTSSITHESASTFTRNVEYGMEASLGVELETKVSNTGVGMSKSIGMNFSSGKDWSTTTSSTETVAFTLYDQDQADLFSVDVYPSFLGWGPVFKLRPGGRTACPHEDALLTEYYLDEPSNQSSNPNYPSFELSARTQQIEKVEISAAPSLLTNIPISDAAVFNLTLTNLSETNDDVIYRVKMDPVSNPFGAYVKIDGNAPSTDVFINGGSSINKVLTIEKGPGPVYDYDSILILLHSICQYDPSSATNDFPDIVDSVYVSAHFLPTCTDVSFIVPSDQWVLNNSFNDTLPVAIDDYNINFFDFNSIRLDYKPTSSAQWIGLQTFYKDTTGLNNPAALEIPTNTAFTLWDWETDQIVDGNYDLRLVTQCTLADKESATHTGVMDRINPHPFGTPSPADGILDPNDDILIRFNEPIDLGSLASLNFDVRGVLNGSETTHASSLAFDGVNDNVEITAGAPLQNRNFTLELSVKRDALGAMTLISQGTDANEQIKLGFNANNELEFTINGMSVTSNTSYTDNDWHYFAVAYNYDNETAELYEASQTTTASIINSGNTTLYPKYTGSGKMLIGKDAANNTAAFSGKIDDVRIWNETKTLSEFSLKKSKLLSSTESKLLYNWRFDESDGILTEDHVRARNGIISGATWAIEPSGNAIEFNGNNYLKVAKGDVNITEEMDYTLSFWFNSTQTTPATLLSTGKADGIASDSLYAWNIEKDANGMLHVLHNGMDFQASNSNLFDGEWHHFALVLNRLGNLTSYIDGNLENSVQALPYKDFGGSTMYVGARGFFTGSVETVDQNFEGKIDEIRFWDASRKFEQIKRDKHNRMIGDEYALRLYLPFENYAIDPTGIPLLSSTISEQMDSTTHTVQNVASVNIITDVPKLKIPRPVESIAFTYSVNNDEIIITPTTASGMIENVTLDITVKGVKDLHGNKMQSPKTWIAYVDKNQVVWQDDVLSFDKAVGDPLSFTSAVVNQGGAAKDFDIENIPSWLSVTPSSATIAPNSVMPINFTLDPYMNIGDYTNDVQLLTDFGFPENLTINVKVRDEEPNWTVDPAQYTNSMSIIGYLKIKDVVSSDEEDMLAAFVGGECRGVTHLQYEPLMDRYYAYLDIYSNLNAGEDITFKIWDASSGTLFSEVNPNIIPFVSNTLIGTINTPQLFETNYSIAVEVSLNSGWNWVADFLLNKDSMDLDKTLESLESVTGDEIKGQEEFSNYLEGNGWVGALNNVGIKPEEAYKIKVSQIDTLVLVGDVLDPTNRTIDLRQGWNWIGFISIRNQSVTDALGNLNPTDGDIIKGKSQFAVYNTQLGWVGSLQAMIPGKGYMYYSNTPTSFVYPIAGMFKSGGVIEENLYVSDTWVVENGKYASNMTNILALDNNSCEYLIGNENLTIGAFDQINECRGVNEISLSKEQGYSFLTIAGNQEEVLGLQLLDEATQQVYPIEESVTYTSNKHLGTLQNPIRISVSEETCMKMQVNAGEIKELFKVYPTVIEGKTTVDYIAPENDTKAKLTLYNIWGQEVVVQNVNLEAGFNRLNIDLGQLHLAGGMYHLVLSTGDSSETVKLIKE